MVELLRSLGVPGGWIHTAELDVLARLLLAGVLGGLVGLEREISGKPAGLRTNLLICVGAALLTEISIGIAAAANAANLADGAFFRADPARIAAQIVSGIGFLGAGTIIQARGSIMGLTSAATIWVVAAIGMAVGSGAYVQAIGATLLVLFSLLLLGRLEDFVTHRRSARHYHLSIDPDPELLEVLVGVIRSAGLRVHAESVEKELERFQVALEISGPVRIHDRMVVELAARAGIHRLTVS